MQQVPGRSSGGVLRRSLVVTALVLTGLIASGAFAEPPSDLAAGFDRKLADALVDAPEGPGVGAAGRVVERFAPPVASGSGSSAFAAGTDGRGALAVNALRPCDTPGAACRNLGGPRAITVPVNAPIVAGTRPGGDAR